MTFDQQILATFIGSVLGFIFAIVLFYITEKIKQKKAMSETKKNLKREFGFNISLLTEWTTKLDKVLRQVTADDHDVFEYFRYSDFQRVFIHTAFQQGILYDSFSDDDFYTLNSILIHFFRETETYLALYISRWKNKDITKKEMLQLFEFEKDKVSKYLKVLKNLREKIK